MDKTLTTHPCPIRGHNHDTVKVADHVQDGTGMRASTFECPSGNYRWFVIDGNELSDVIRQVKPGFGWRR